MGSRKLPGYGLGWFIGERAGYRVVEHGGNLAGFQSLVYLVPEHDLGFALLTNVASSSFPDAVVNEIWTHLIEQPHRAAVVVPASGAERPEAKKAVSTKTQPKPDEAAGREIIAKAVAAAGGERLRKHGTMTVLADVDLNSQGLSGKQVENWKAPIALWRLLGWAPRMVTATTDFGAFGKSVFVENISFDGAWCRRDFAGLSMDGHDGQVESYDLLDWQSVYAKVALLGQVRVGDEPAYKILKVTRTGKRILDYVSPTSFLVLKREVPTDLGTYVKIFEDYREIDGVTIAMRTIINDPILGSMTRQVRDVKFGG